MQSQQVIIQLRGTNTRQHILCLGKTFPDNVVQQRNTGVGNVVIRQNVLVVVIIALSLVLHTVPVLGQNLLSVFLASQQDGIVDCLE